MGAATLWALSLQLMLWVGRGSDTAWLLTAATALHQGGELGRTILETNQPLAVWMHLPAVWMAEGRGGNAWQWWLTSLGLLAAATGLLTARMTACATGFHTIPYPGSPDRRRW